MNNYVKRLTRFASAYRDAEAKVVRAFFKTPRTKKEHLRWLKAQGFKEYSAIKPIIDALTVLYPSIDLGIHRRDYAELTEKLADETKHARLSWICSKRSAARTSLLAISLGYPKTESLPRCEPNTPRASPGFYTAQ